jgi:hypothetical protein
MATKKAPARKAVKAPTKKAPVKAAPVVSKKLAAATKAYNKTQILSTLSQLTGVNKNKPGMYSMD